MFGQIPVIEREGTFGRIGARVPGSQHPGAHIGESYRGTLHLSDRSVHCRYQPDCDGCDVACTAERTFEAVLIQ